MFVQINTDNQIKSDAEANERLEQKVRERLRRYEDRLTHVEVHISDVDAHKHHGDDKRASLEARPNGLAPVGVVADARTIEAAVSDAAAKCAKALEKTFGRLTDRKGH